MYCIYISIIVLCMCMYIYNIVYVYIYTYFCMLMEPIDLSTSRAHPTYPECFLRLGPTRFRRLRRRPFTGSRALKLSVLTMETMGMGPNLLLPHLGTKHQYWPAIIGYPGYQGFDSWPYGLIGKHRRYFKHMGFVWIRNG